MNLKTEGIKYMGSKKKMLKHISDCINGYKITSVFDGFAGTTRVGQFFANNGFKVASNDLNIWSKTFGLCYLTNDIERKVIKEKVIYLNSIAGKAGYFSENYGGIVGEDNTSIQLDGKKRIWQMHNAMKLDAIRDEIEKISKSEVEKATLITSLILALDKVDSSLGHQASYLSKWSKRSFQDLTLMVPDYKIFSQKNEIYSGDIFEVIDKTKEYDLTYYDPPYGSSNDIMPSSRVRYGQYYHIWKSIILNDRMETIGKINKRKDSDVQSTYSIFEEYKKEDNIFIAETAIQELIKNTQSKYILFSYNNNSRVPIQNIEQYLIDNHYEFKTERIEYQKNRMASLSSTNEWNVLSGKENYEVLIFIKNKVC